MGFNCETGAFVSLTNVRMKGGAQPPAAASRGKLVQSILERSWSHSETRVFFPPIPAASQHQAVDNTPHAHLLDARYAGFNMLCGRLCRGVMPSLQLASNRPWLPDQEDDPAIALVTDAPRGRVTCFSNGTLAARWRKTDWLRDEVAACIAVAPLPPAPAADNSATAAATKLPSSATRPASDFSDAYSADAAGLSNCAARALFDALERAVLRDGVRFDDAELSAAGDDADLLLSELSPAAERRLRRHVFLPPAPAPSPVPSAAPAAADIADAAAADAAELAAAAAEPFFVVTRSLSAIIVVSGHVHYFFRDTTAHPALGPVFHHAVPLPPP